MRPLLAVPLLALAAVSVVACGGDDGDEGSDDTGTPAADLAAAIDGRTLVVTSITEDGEDREPVEGTEIRITFDGPNLGVDAGCNGMGAEVRLEGRVLVVGDINTTEMACDPARTAQDGWLASVLQARPTVALDGDEVVLTADGTILVLADREDVRPDAALVGTTWVLDTIFEGDGPDAAASSAPAGVVASVTFTDDGTFGIETGCNAGSGDYEVVSVVDGTTSLQLGPAAVTRLGCTDDAGSSVEEAVLATFVAGPAEVEVDDQRLTLTTPTGTLGFTAG